MEFEDFDPNSSDSYLTISDSNPLLSTCNFSDSADDVYSSIEILRKAGTTYNPPLPLDLEIPDFLKDIVPYEGRDLETSLQQNDAQDFCSTFASAADLEAAEAFQDVMCLSSIYSQDSESETCMTSLLCDKGEGLLSPIQALMETTPPIEEVPFPTLAPVKTKMVKSVQQTSVSAKCSTNLFDGVQMKPCRSTPKKAKISSEPTVLASTPKSNSFALEAHGNIVKAPKLFNNELSTIVTFKSSQTISDSDVSPVLIKHPQKPMTSPRKVGCFQKQISISRTNGTIIISHHKNLTFVSKDCKETYNEVENNKSTSETCIGHEDISVSKPHPKPIGQSFTLYKQQHNPFYLKVPSPEHDKCDASPSDISLAQIGRQTKILNCQPLITLQKRQHPSCKQISLGTMSSTPTCPQPKVSQILMKNKCERKKSSPAVSLLKPSKKGKDPVCDIILMKKSGSKDFQKVMKYNKPLVRIKEFPIDDLLKRN